MTLDMFCMELEALSREIKKLERKWTVRIMRDSRGRVSYHHKTPKEKKRCQEQTALSNNQTRGPLSGAKTQAPEVTMLQSYTGGGHV